MCGKQILSEISKTVTRLIKIALKWGESHGTSYWKPHSKLKTKISPYKWIINVKRNIHFSVIYHLLSYKNKIKFTADFSAFWFLEN